MSDDEYVYDEESGEWMPASELAAKRAAAEGVEQLRAQGEAAFDSLRGNARDLEEQVLANVREKPLTSLAIAAGVGFLFAVLSRR